MNIKQFVTSIINHWDYLNKKFSAGSKLALTLGEAELFAGADDLGNTQEIDMNNPQDVEKLQAELELSVYSNFDLPADSKNTKLEFVKAIFKKNQI